MLDVFAVLALGDVGDEQPQRLHAAHDQLARAVHAITLEAVEAEEFIRHQAIGGLAHVGLGIEHVEHLGRGKARALADLEVVEVMPRRDLDAARAKLRIGVLVGDHRDAAAGQRQDHVLADHALIARVGGVHRYRHVGQHRLGPGGGNLEIVAPVIEPRAVGKRILEVPEAARDGLRLDFEIGNRGLQLGVPVHQPLVAVDEAVVVEVDEGLDHRAGEVRVHRELLAAPVHRAAEAAQLVGDGAAAFGLPLPHLLDEGLAGVVGALVLPRLHLALDHHLRGDPRVVGADHPQRILAAQALITDHHVLQGVVERVADVEAAGDVRRRVDDGEGFRVRAGRAEATVRFPVGIPARLDLGGVESGGQVIAHDGSAHASTHVAMQ